MNQKDKEKLIYDLSTKIKLHKVMRAIYYQVQDGRWVDRWNEKMKDLEKQLTDAKAL